MLSAFTARPIVELKQRDKSRIESVLAYGDRLLVGLNTGNLRIYRVNEAAEGESAQNGDSKTDDRPESQPKARFTELLREQEKFARYKIEQLAIIKEANILISLSNGYVSIHDLQTYELQEQLTKTKGAITFAVTSNVVKDEDTDVPSIVSRLAVAVKRRLLLWSWHDMELAPEATEIALASSIKSLTWATGTKVLAGLNSSYVLVNVETEEVTDITGPGSIGGGPGQDTSTGRMGMAGMGYIGMGGMIPRPLATKLGEGEMLLAKDINTHFIDADGNSLGRRQIRWASAPEAIGYSYPYVLALHAGSKEAMLEVRNPETLSMLQSIPLPGAKQLHVPQPNISLAHAGKGFLVLSDRCIWRMGALDYDSQIDVLVENSNLDEAISLLGMLEDTLITNKEIRLREIKMQKAQKLFSQRRYRASLDLFTEVSAPPERVIKLYPRLIAADSSSVEETRDAERNGNDHGHQEEESNAQSQSQKEDSPDSEADPSKGLKPPPDLASVSDLKKRETGDSSDAGSIKAKPSDTDDKPLEGKDLRNACLELHAFLADARAKLQRHLNPDGTLKEAAESLPDSRPDDAALAQKGLLLASTSIDDPDRGEKLLQTAKLVDTTLFRTDMYAIPSLAVSLFRIANFCDPDVVMEKLEESGRYSELVDFLYGKKLHRPALELLKKYGESDTQDENAPQLHGPARTVLYLQSLPPEMIDLILEFAEWPLKRDPDLGMEVFLADTENAETLPRQRVMDFLQRQDTDLALRYLEHLINELNDMTPELHQRLLVLYLEKLKSHDDAKTPAFATGEDKEAMRKKFLDLLKSSQQYSPERMLSRLPKDGLSCYITANGIKLTVFLDPEMYEPRAAVFSKLGQHRQALEIYVFKLDNPEKAEEYVFVKAPYRLNRVTNHHRYCNTVYLSENVPEISAAPFQRPSTTDPEDAQPGIYHTLLSLYLTPPLPNQPQWGPALNILAKHGSRLPASSTLEIIPKTLPVKELESYMRGRIRYANSIVNEGRIVAGLRKTQTSAAQAALLLGDGLPENNAGRNRRVVVNDERVCPVCHKRLGGSVISVFPDDSVVHLGCAGRRKVLS